MILYGFTKQLDIGFEQAIEVTTNELKNEDFGILTRIPIHEKFKEKLSIDFHKYLILGVCNPPSAHKAILAEENIGLMLPCNVILYEKEGKTVLSVIRPTVAMGMIENNALHEIAAKIETKLQHAFERIAQDCTKSGDIEPELQKVPQTSIP